MSHSLGWIGVDLDGTLAEYHGWVSDTHYSLRRNTDTAVISAVFVVGWSVVAYIFH